MRANLKIQQLMMEKIGRVIDAADEAYLDHLIETDSVVASVWHHTLQLYSTEDIETGFDRFDHLQWEDITTLPADSNIPVPIPWEQDKQSDELIPFLLQEETPDALQPAPTTAAQRIHPAIWPAAAAVLVAVIAAWWQFQPRQSVPQHLNLVDKKRGVQLQLANGKVVNLSKDSGTIALQQLHFTNSHKTLSLATSTIDSSKRNETLTLVVPVGLDYKVRLSDGSDVWLNSATTMRFSVPFQGKIREVFIEGEAFIHVAKDVNRPFFVHTAHSTVQVLGTSFNVNSYDNGTIKVSLVEGAVRMLENGEEVTLKPGQQAIATGKGIDILPFDETEELSWRQGIFHFSNTSLAEIASVLPRWFGIPVIMDNARIASETFTGSLERNQSIHIFLENLKSTTTVDYYFDKNGRLHFK
ncbi:FecR family protein [Chitinophaga varians]|uniref:FecR family protein n=1 Tax=Chitinophaga varians TaxID=2202339 RepID=UPI00165F961D|nr:FecR domain-containing protein [Chitinophaga varians]MBC9915558.1 FecR domain-containing protein [Chitinophaga varians]